jgi:hypothetical protein
MSDQLHVPKALPLVMGFSESVEPDTKPISTLRRREKSVPRTKPRISDRGTCN